MSEDQPPEILDLTGGEIEIFKRGIKRFWRQNMLTSKPGAKEDGCPPGSVRTDVPRSIIYDVDDPDNHRPKFAFWKAKTQEPE